MSLLRRVETLEGDQQRAATADAEEGRRLEIWRKLVEWAVLVHEAGGWNAAIALVERVRREVYIRREPRDGEERLGLELQRFAPTWYLSIFAGSGRLTGGSTWSEKPNEMIYLIAWYVGLLLDLGAAPADLEEWVAARQFLEVWDAVEGTKTAEQGARDE